MNTDWIKPYTVISKGRFHYEVVFEETVLLSSNNHYDAERLAAMLNGAYMLGRSSAQLEIELAQET